MLAEDLVRTAPAGSLIVASSETEVRVSNDINTNGLAPCNHEEADTRMFVHIKHAANRGHRKVTLRTVDTDVVVLSLSFFSELGVEELWIEFGVGKLRRWLPIHEYVTKLGADIYRGLPFCYSFTGCDNVSAFSGKGKKVAWSTWKIFPEITETFIK